MWEEALQGGPGEGRAQGIADVPVHLRQEGRRRAAAAENRRCIRRTRPGRGAAGDVEALGQPFARQRGDTAYPRPKPSRGATIAARIVAAPPLFRLNSSGRKDCSQRRIALHVTRLWYRRI